MQTQEIRHLRLPETRICALLHTTKAMLKSTAFRNQKNIRDGLFLTNWSPSFPVRQISRAGSSIKKKRQSTLCNWLV